MGVLELVDKFHLGWNGCKTVRVQILSPIFTNCIYFSLRKYCKRYLFIISYIYIYMLLEYIKFRIFKSFLFFFNKL